MWVACSLELASYCSVMQSGNDASNWGLGGVWFVGWGQWLVSLCGGLTPP